MNDKSNSDNDDKEFIDKNVDGNLDFIHKDFVRRDPKKIGDEVKSFQDHLIDLKGKLLELFIGEQAETLNYDDYSVVSNSSTFGRLVDVFDRFVVLECLYLDDNNNIKYGNKVYINAFQIRAMTLLNKQGSLQDIFISNRKASTIRKMLTLPNEPEDTNKY